MIPGFFYCRRARSGHAFYFSQRYEYTLYFLDCRQHAARAMHADAPTDRDKRACAGRADRVDAGRVLLLG